MLYEHLLVMRSSTILDALQASTILDALRASFGYAVFRSKMLDALQAGISL
jgi:hypothetical protein